MNREEREALPVFRVVMNRPASTAAAQTLKTTTSRGSG